MGHFDHFYVIQQQRLKLATF